MRATLYFRAVLATVGWGLAAAVSAQPAPPASAPTVRDETVLDRRTQRVEHIRTEDAGTRVDEVRSGGETKSIQVQPKAAVLAYEERPADASGPGANHRDAGPGAAGARVRQLMFY